MSASGAGKGISEWIGITVQPIPQLLVYIQVSCMYDSQFNKTPKNSLLDFIWIKLLKICMYI